MKKVTIAWIARDVDGFVQVFHKKPRWDRRYWLRDTLRGRSPINCEWLRSFPTSSVKKGECKRVRITVEIEDK